MFGLVFNKPKYKYTSNFLDFFQLRETDIVRLISAEHQEGFSPKRILETYSFDYTI